MTIWEWTHIVMTVTPNGRCWGSVELVTEEVNDTNAAGADHMGERDIDIVRNLARPGLAAHLPENLGDVAQTGRPEGMAHRYQSATRIHRNAALNRGGFFLNQTPALALRR